MKQIDDYMDYCNREHCSLKLKNRVLLYIETGLHSVSE